MILRLQMRKWQFKAFMQIKCKKTKIKPAVDVSCYGVDLMIQICQWLFKSRAPTGFLGT